MTLSTTASLRLTFAGVLAFAAVTMTGCAPEPEPTPTPTAAFASEEEAFAAAEEVYRAYTEALNAQRSGDVSAEPLDYLTGLALESELEAYDAIKAQGLTLHGTSSVERFVPLSADLVAHPALLSAAVCVDISATRVLDASGNDVTPTNRRDLLPLDVTFVVGETSLQISDSQSTEADRC